MGAGILVEQGAALVFFLCIITLQVAPLLVELTREVGLSCPPQLVGYLFPVVLKLGFE